MDMKEENFKVRVINFKTMKIRIRIKKLFQPVHSFFKTLQKKHKPAIKKNPRLKSLDR